MVHFWRLTRSNDLYLGTPHNVVQFTCLQEIMAGWLGIEVGSYVQICDSLHLYEHDLAHFTVSLQVPSVRNTDTLALPKKDFDCTVAMPCRRLRHSSLLPLSRR
ncbi:thymidylate synthase [Collimonas pratensis]|uniref:thymidylate synthase n=1 Tax=Collimonas pratensis TaxID=279113 RepID=UPI003AAA96BC